MQFTDLPTSEQRAIIKYHSGTLITAILSGASVYSMFKCKEKLLPCMIGVNCLVTTVLALRADKVIDTFGWNWKNFKNKQVYSLVLSTWTHWSVYHLVMNMFVLWYCGRRMISRLGALQFLLYYQASGLICQLASVFWYKYFYPTQAFTTIGASGCIIAMFTVDSLIDVTLGFPWTVLVYEGCFFIRELWQYWKHGVATMNTKEDHFSHLLSMGLGVLIFHHLQRRYCG